MHDATCAAAKVAHNQVTRVRNLFYKAAALLNEQLWVI